VTRQPAPPRPVRPGRPASPIATADLPVLIGGAVGFAVLGFLVGAGGAFLQARTVQVGIRWPVGALFALVVLGAVALSASILTRSRLGLGVITIGWAVSVLLFTAGRPEGDVIIAADLPGYAYLFGGVVVLGALSTLRYSALAEHSPE
jgi:hypothetical protein